MKPQRMNGISNMKKIFVFALFPLLCSCSTNDTFLKVNYDTFCQRADSIVPTYFKSFDVELDTFEEDYDYNDSIIVKRERHEAMYDNDAHFTWIDLKNFCYVVRGFDETDYFYITLNYFRYPSFEHYFQKPSYYIGNSFKIVDGYEYTDSYYDHQINIEFVFGNNGYIKSILSKQERTLLFEHTVGLQSSVSTTKYTFTWHR